MSSNGNVLRQIIRDSSSVVDACVTAISINQAKINDFNKKITAVKEGVSDVAASKLENYLTLEKYPTDCTMVKGPTYDLSYDISGTLTDWRILSVQLDDSNISMPSFIVFNDSTFYSEGDITFMFTQHPYKHDIGVGVRNLSTLEISDIRTTNILDSTFDSTSDITYVMVVDPILTVSDNVIFLYEAEYNDPVDSTADVWISDWNFAHDYLLHPIDLDGTYGLIPNRDSISTGNGVLNANKEKNTNLQTVFDPYAAQHE